MMHQLFNFCRAHFSFHLIKHYRDNGQWKGRVPPIDLYSNLDGQLLRRAGRGIVPI